jgi:hypothetical protein
VCEEVTGYVGFDATSDDGACISAQGEGGFSLFFDGSGYYSNSTCDTQAQNGYYSDGVEWIQISSGVGEFSDQCGDVEEFQ